MARDLTISNTAGPDAHQAVAFRSTGDRTVLDTVELLGHQDTLYAHAMRQFYTRCRVSGTVDFVFGNSATVLRDTALIVQPRQLRPEKGENDAVTAQGRTDPAQPTGIVLHGCSVNGSDDYMALYRQKPDVHHVYLGRPWKEYSRTVYVGCTLSEMCSRAGGWRGTATSRSRRSTTASTRAPAPAATAPAGAGSGGAARCPRTTSTCTASPASYRVTSGYPKYIS